MHDWLKLKEDEIVLEDITTFSTSTTTSSIIVKNRNKSNKFYMYLKKLREKLSKNRLKRINLKKNSFDNFCKKFQNSLVLPENNSNIIASRKNHLVKPVFEKRQVKKINDKEEEKEDEEKNDEKNLFLKKTYPNKLLITPQYRSLSNNYNNINNNNAIFWCKICKYHCFGSSSSFFYNSINNTFCSPSATNFTNLIKSGKHKLVDDKLKNKKKAKKLQVPNESINKNFDILKFNEQQNNKKKNKKKEKILCDYKKVLCSIYVDCKQQNQINNNSEPIVCNCTELDDNQYGCVKRCLNRMTYTECDANFCNLKEKCSNQSIQKRKWVKSLEVFKTPDNRGYGIRTNSTIKRGLFIIEYVGEVIKEDEFKNRMKNLYKNEVNHYTLSLDSGLVIDSYRVGCIARYINHSCEPNCEVQKWIVNGQYRMCIFAIQDILPGVELTYDYKFHSFNSENMQECKCGSQKCRGYVGPIKQNMLKKKSLKEKYEELKRFNLYYYRNKTLNNFKNIDESSFVITKKEFNYIKSHDLFLMRNRVKSIVKIQKFNSKVLKEEEAVKFEDSGEKEEIKILAKTYFNSMKNNSNLVSTRRLNRKSYLVAKLSFICINIYESLLSFINSARSRIEDFNKFDDLLFKCKDNNLNLVLKRINEVHYEKYHQFEVDLFSVFRSALSFYGVDEISIQFINEIKNNYYQILTEYVIEIKELEEEECGDETRKKSKNLKDEKFDVYDFLLNEVIDKICVEFNRGKFQSEKMEMKPVLLKSSQKSNNLSNIIIDCICNTYDEQKRSFIMCQLCEKYQHTDCVNFEKNNYNCPKCETKDFNREIVLKKQPKDALSGLTYFNCLSRDDDLQVKVSECYYVMKDRENLITIDGKIRKISKLVLGLLHPVDCDIVKIEHLWINENGDKFGSGFYFIRPVDTFHEPNKKFYRNEVVKYPVQDLFPLCAVVRQCFVTDLNTYCKGKPKSAKSINDIYICEFKVDKKARTFTKYKYEHVINTKQYCFDIYDTRLKIKRDFRPHYNDNFNEKNLIPKKQSSNSNKCKKLKDFRKKSENLSSIIDTLNDVVNE